MERQAGAPGQGLGYATSLVLPLTWGRGGGGREGGGWYGSNHFLE
jgi:hypothetical protein